jgi:hypothetical protein
LKAFFFPWADGWPTTVHRLPARMFADPDGAKFWDTVCYVGWWPWIAALFLLERAIRRRGTPDRRLPRARRDRDRSLPPRRCRPRRRSRARSA